MLVPVWLGYLMLTSFSLSIVVIAIWAIIYAGGVLINVIIPNMWIVRQRFKTKNMSKEKFDAYITALRYEWTENHVRKGRRESESKEE